MISFDRVAEVYDATRGYPPKVADRIADGLARLFRRPAATPNVVEPGVGTGRMAVPLAGRGIRITGVDIAPAMLSRLQRKEPRIPAALARADLLPFRDNAFDGALLVHLLHLVPDANDVMRETCRVLRPGAVVVFGGDDAPTGLLRDIAEAVQEAGAAAGIDRRLWDRYPTSLEAGQQALQTAGAELRSQVLAAWPTTLTARALLERMRKRVNSHTWELPDDLLEELLARAAPALEHLCGALDREHDAERGFRVWVGQLPESGQQL